MVKKSFLTKKITTDHKILFYVSLIVAFAMNANGMISIFHPEMEIVFDIPWVFNLFESLYQILLGWTYYFILGVLLLSVANIDKTDSRELKMMKLTMLLLYFIFSLLFRVLSQKYLFDNLMNSIIYRSAFIIRVIGSSGLIYILVRVLKLSKDRRAKELENEMLKSAYYNAQLKNLRAQVNPHFLFNSFSSLSSLIVENTDTAQKYVGNLAKIFRYSLAEHTPPLVELSKEIESLEANIELLKIRFEDNLKITTELDDITEYKIPSMSLQPLLENVTKHNLISERSPSYIQVYIEKDELHFVNGVTVAKFDTPSNGIGLFNLNERYKLLIEKPISIEKTEDQFRVILPLVVNNQLWV